MDAVVTSVPETSAVVSVPHAWMPVSPCGTGCVQHRPEVGVLRAGLRAATAISVLLAYPFAHIVTPSSRRTGVQRQFARILLRACGIRLRVVDRRPGAGTTTRYADPGTAALVACGHIGWADIVVLASVQPLAFVARADLISWPVLGRLARVMRVVPIERERLRRLPEVVEQVGRRLRAGERIGFFPEGTTWCGSAYGRLRPALFQAAVDTAVPVQPVRLRYLDAHGNRCTVPAFVGDDTLIDSIARVLRARDLTAEVVLAPVEPAGTDRKDLARRCERAIRDEELSNAAHAVLRAAGRQLVEVSAAQARAKRRPPARYPHRVGVGWDDPVQLRKNDVDRAEYSLPRGGGEHGTESIRARPRTPGIARVRETESGPPRTRVLSREISATAFTEDRSTNMHDDNPGLFSRLPAAPEPYSMTADAPQPVFRTAVPEPEISSASDTGTG